MATIVLQVPDETLVNKVRQVCNMLQGVVSVKVEKAKERETPVVEDFDITKTAAFKEAMDDVKNGRVTEYESVDDLFDKLGIKV